MTPAELQQTNFESWARYVQTHMETALEILLPGADTLPHRLHDAMRYSALGGGKRVRPLLCFAAGQLVEATDAVLAPVAASLECIHAYSLVHDERRRGKPTCHAQYAAPPALLVGDSLHTEACELLADVEALPAAQRVALVKELAHASGSRGMAGGQAIDLESVGKALTLPELELMHIMKTGALIRASVRMGARCHLAADRALDGAQHEQLDR